MLRDTWSALDALEISLLVVDAKLTPIYLTTAGARMLQVKARHELDSDCAALKPLLNLVKQARRKGNRGIDSHRSSHTSLTYQEINLTTTDGHTFLALAYCRELDRSGLAYGKATLQPPPSETYGVVFYSLNALQPFFELLEHSRRVRALGIFHGCRSAAQSITKRVSGSGVDLLAVVTAAVGVVDPLIPSSIKVTTEIQTTALLDIDEEVLMRILSHLIMEASDYIGACGRVKISVQLVPAANGDILRVEANPREEALSKMEITVLASREFEVSPELSPLERYLYKSCLPRQHKVSISESASESPDTAELLTKSKNPLSALIEAHSQPAFQGQSENITIASDLAAKVGVTIHLKAIRSGLLAIYCCAPLFQPIMR